MPPHSLPREAAQGSRQRKSLAKFAGRAYLVFMVEEFGIVKGLRRWFGVRTKEDDLVYLLMAAKEDEVIRRQLLEILDQPDFTRQSLLNTWIAELTAASAPPALIRAISMLVDNDRAARARQIITAEEDGQINS